MSGVRIYKPFVEKPADGEDHNVHIYYPHSMVSPQPDVAFDCECHEGAALREQRSA